MHFNSSFTSLLVILYRSETTCLAVKFRAAKTQSVNRRTYEHFGSYLMMQLQLQSFESKRKLFKNGE